LRRTDGLPFVTDGGNHIADCAIASIDAPKRLETELHALPGVMETGLFIGMASKVIVGGPTRRGGVRTMKTLAIDIGGTGLKASVLDEQGQMLVKRVRMPTPHPSRPKDLMAGLDGNGEAAARLRPHLGRLPRRDTRRQGDHRAASRHQGMARLPAAGRAHQAVRQACPGRERRRGAGAWHHHRPGARGRADSRHRHRQRDLRQRPHDAPPRTGPSPHPQDPVPTTITSATMRARTSARRVERARAKTIDIVERAAELRHALSRRRQLRERHVGKLPPNVKLASNDKGITGGIHLWDDAVWREASR
jgi:polyphosphate glucokinase